MSQTSKQQIEHQYRNSFIKAEGEMQEDQEKGELSQPKAEIVATESVHNTVQVKPDEAPGSDSQMQDIAGNGGGCANLNLSDSDLAMLRKQLLKKPTSSLERKRCEKQRKARQMRRLRKWLVPKNAIVALHELLGPGMSEFVINTVGHMTKAELTVNNVKYEAVGSSKNQAKTKVCEKALRDMTISQLSRAKQQQEAAETAKSKATASSQASSALSEADIDADGSMHGSEMDVDEDGESDGLPMEHLAAFALHKLFTEWENDGFEVPQLKPVKTKQVAPAEESNNVGQPSVPKVTKTIKDLPPDAAKRIPTALFAYMRPQVAYQDLGLSTEDPMNREYCVSLDVDGKQFFGRGRSKKLARKAAAIDACKGLFGVEFETK